MEVFVFVVIINCQVLSLFYIPDKLNIMEMNFTK